MSPKAVRECCLVLLRGSCFPGRHQSTKRLRNFWCDTCENLPQKPLMSSLHKIWNLNTIASLRVSTGVSTNDCV